MYGCSITFVIVLLTFCWCVGYSSVLCVAVLTVPCSWFCFYIGDRMCVRVTGVHFLQCSEYWVMCINVCVIHT
jgi:hypothetical protein